MLMAAESVEPGPYDAVEYELGVLLRRARSISAEMGRAVHPDLEPGAYGLLVGIHDRPRGRPSDLADHFGIGKATMSRQLKALEGLGLVAREPDPGDGRAHLLVLTEQGRTRLDHARTARMARFNALLGTWPEDDVRLLAGLLGRLNRLVDTMSETAPRGQARIAQG